MLSTAKAFPDSPIYTALYEPTRTFPEFQLLPVRTLPLNRLSVLRHDHRRALPLLAQAYSRLLLDVDVLLCTSTGWSHGIRTTGRKVVYWHSPAKWLYHNDQYRGAGRRMGNAALLVLRKPLMRWDRRAVETVHRHLCSSSSVRERLARVYGVQAEVVPCPVTFGAAGPSEPVDCEPGYLLCVSRLLPYKNVDVVVDAFRQLPTRRLVVVGTGPEEQRLKAGASSNVTFIRSVSEAQLRWLYQHSVAVITPSREDFGLVPIEAACFGIPALALRAGGFLDTVVESATGVFFDHVDAGEVIRGVEDVLSRKWDDVRIRDHADAFSEARYAERLRAVVEKESALTG
jgi:glycosyltransferase involved in cell wall biosynthesis